MNADTPRSAHAAAPGTEKPRRFRPKLRYELIGCGLHGHEILGTDAAALRTEDELFARESGGLRWYRCMRCDSWVALPPPEHPARKYPPARDEITLPLRGKPLRDRYVLRLIAVDRALHFLILSALAAAVFLFADNRAALNAEFTRILNDLQGGVGGPMTNSRHGIVHDLRTLFAVSITNLYLAGAAIAAYAGLEGVEAVGLWFAKRWAEYLTFVATIVFLPYEVDELIKSVTALKLVALIINLAVAVYLLYAKRLFGVHGGGRAERAERDEDTGWAPIERATPKGTPEPRLPDVTVSRRVAGPGTPSVHLNITSRTATGPHAAPAAFGAAAALGGGRASELRDGQRQRPGSAAVACRQALVLRADGDLHRPVRTVLGGDRPVLDARGGDRLRRRPGDPAVRGDRRERGQCQRPPPQVVLRPGFGAGRRRSGCRGCGGS